MPKIIKRIVKENFFTLALSVICGWAEVIFTVKALLLIGGLLDIALGTIEENIQFYVLKTIFFVLLMFLMSTLQMIFQQNFSIRSVTRLRSELIKQLFRRPTNYFYKKSYDEYISLLETDIEQLRLYYFKNIPSVIKGLGQVIIYAVTLMRFNILIFVTSVLVSILPMLINKAFVKPLNKVQIDRSTKNSIYIEKLNDILNGYSQIKMSKNYPKFMTGFEESDLDKLKAVKKINVLQTIAFQGLFAANFISIGTIILVGSILVSQGKMNTAEVIAAMSMVSTGSNALGSMLRDFLELKSTRDLMVKTTENLSSDIVAEEKNCEVINFPVTIKNLNFSFGPKNIFKSFSFDFARRGNYAIVGDSGAGKSTLAKLLLKELDGYSGEISFGGVNLLDICEFDLFDFIDYIPQNPYVFSDNLRNNISLLGELDDNRLKEIIKLVNLDDLYSRYGEEKINPTKLSGGEKQRIAIARSIYKNSSLIIFDEPTSGLDPVNQDNINNLIFSLKDRTNIVITHNWNKDFLSKFDDVIKVGNGGERYIIN